MTQKNDETTSPAVLVEPALALVEPSATRELLTQAIPSVVAMTSFTLMQFVDKIMVSQIGPDPVYVGAQGSGGLAAWIPTSIMYGTLAVVNTFVAQNLGAGTPQRGPAYAWNALWLAVVAWLLLIPYGLSMPWIFSTLGYDARRVELACDYGQVLVFGSIFNMAARSIGQFFYGLHRPRVVMSAVLAGNITDLIFNYILIFGYLGFPALGVKGAAISTVMGNFVEFAVPMAVFLGPKLHSELKTRVAWRPDIKKMKEILSLGWPAGLMFGSEMVCWGYFMVYLVGSRSAEASTAGFIAQQWMSVSFMPAVGLGNAISSVVGKYIGMRRPDLALQRAKVGIVMAAVYMGTCAILFLVFRHPMVGMFVPKETPLEAREMVIRLGGQFLIATAAFQIFDAIAMTIGGALRGAGDTKFIGVATVVLAWGCLVGLGWAFTEYFPQWGPMGPWIAAAIYIFALAVASMWRFASGKWKTMSVVGPVVAH